MFVQRILPAILVVIPAAVVATVHGSSSEPAVDQCKTKPGLLVAKGTHWYYHLDRATKRQCWYLAGAIAGQHANVNAPEASATAPAVPVPQQRPAAVQTAQAPQQQAAGITPPEPAATAGAPLVELPVRNELDAADFAGRWPNLPLTDIGSVNFGSQSKSATKSSRLSSSYAEDSADEDASPQIAMTWPVVDAVTAQPGTSAVDALQPLYLAGGAVMVLLFLAGWGFGQVRGRRIHVAPPLVADGDAGTIENRAAVVKARAPVRSRPTPTDPARDLKKSLGELMGDLQRAGAAVEARPLPARKPKRRAAAVQNARQLETVD